LVRLPTGLPKCCGRASGAVSARSAT
jgi:hypothetical protein